MARIIQSPQNNPDKHYVYNKVFSKEDIKKIISMCNSLPQSVGSVGTGSEKTTLEDGGEIRTSIVKWIPETEKSNWIYQKIIDLGIEANNVEWQFDLVASLELIQYTEYHASEKGHYDWHLDLGVGDQQCKRKVSITIQLSDSNDYEGGDLLICKGGRGTGNLDNYDMCPRDQGLGVVFPSYLLHRVTPVTKGIRKSLVLWIGGSKFR